jgi:hypothetical protein
MKRAGLTRREASEGRSSNVTNHEKHGPRGALQVYTLPDGQGQSGRELRRV